MQNEIGEQPENIIQTQGEESQNNLGVNDSENGSLGKFKNAEALLSAYNNLQAEFTRKCQKLSEFEKEKNDNIDEKINLEKNNILNENDTKENILNEKINDTENEKLINSKDNIENLDNNSDNSLNQTKVENENELPIYKRDDWTKKVMEFLKTNAEAKPYSKEICEEVMRNDDLKNNQNALELAWGKVMQSMYKSPAEIDSDEFIDTLISKDNIKKKVAEILAREIANKKVPTTIGSHSSSTIPLTHFKEPTNLQEAKEIISKLFNN